jgi:hypothetical protein
MFTTPKVNALPQLKVEVALVKEPEVPTKFNFTKSPSAFLGLDGSRRNAFNYLISHRGFSTRTKGGSAL